RSPFMPLVGELNYFQSLGEAGKSHALNKPFTGATRGLTFMQVGAMLNLLPPPPARVLECGCGTGWLTRILQKCGYQAVGIDVSDEAIRMARQNRLLELPAAPEFEVMDSERMTFDAEFDAVVFFESLHHSVDER